MNPLDSWPQGGEVRLGFVTPETDLLKAVRKACDELCQLLQHQAQRSADMVEVRVLLFLRRELDHIKKVQIST